MEFTSLNLPCLTEELILQYSYQKSPFPQINIQTQKSVKPETILKQNPENDVVDALSDVTVRMPLKSFVNIQVIFNMLFCKIIFHKKEIESKLYCLRKSLFKRFFQL